ncbi:TPA: hypothetical protein R8F97_005895 [Pseudomonas putida]|nr:hypothetical protein [Pseudomonas putida]
MTGFVKVSASNGVFDFTANLIEIKKYGSSARALMTRAVSGDAEVKELEESKVLRNMKSLVVHECAHFLDLTTTLWGVEYVIRKNLLAKAISLDEEIEIKREVSLINVSELHAHEQLIIKSGVGLLKATHLNHEVVVDKRFGPIIYIYYNVADVRICSVPLSMLAVLEANAYSCEVLSRIYDAENLADPVAKFLAMEEAKSDLDVILDDPDQSEYTVLISLLKLHYPELSIKELLILVTVIVRFALDLNGLEMSAIANFIQSSIVNFRAGAELSHDMRGGASRAVIAFKTILMMHAWRNTLDESERSSHDLMLKADPAAAIRNFWTSIGVVSFSDFITDLSFEASLKGIMSSCMLQEEIEIYSASQGNRMALRQGNVASVGLANLRLMDIFLEDGGVFSMPNRIDVDIEKYLLDYAGLSGEIDKLCHKDRAYKR